MLKYDPKSSVKPVVDIRTKFLSTTYLLDFAQTFSQKITSQLKKSLFECDFTVYNCGVIEASQNIAIHHDELLEEFLTNKNLKIQFMLRSVENLEDFELLLCIILESARDLTRREIVLMLWMTAHWYKEEKQLLEAKFFILAAIHILEETPDHFKMLEHIIVYELAATLWVDNISLFTKFMLNKIKAQSQPISSTNDTIVKYQKQAIAEYIYELIFTLINNYYKGQPLINLDEQSIGLPLQHLTIDQLTLLSEVITSNFVELLPVANEESEIRHSASLVLRGISSVLKRFISDSTDTNQVNNITQRLINCVAENKLTICNILQPYQPLILTLLDRIGSQLKTASEISQQLRALVITKPRSLTPDERINLTIVSYWISRLEALSKQPQFKHSRDLIETLQQEMNKQHSMYVSYNSIANSIEEFKLNLKLCKDPRAVDLIIELQTVFEQIAFLNAEEYQVNWKNSLDSLVRILQQNLPIRPTEKTWVPVNDKKTRQPQKKKAKPTNRINKKSRPVDVAKVKVEEIRPGTPVLAEPWLVAFSKEPEQKTLQEDIFQTMRMAHVLKAKKPALGYLAQAKTLNDKLANLAHDTVTKAYVLLNNINIYQIEYLKLDSIFKAPLDQYEALFKRRISLLSQLTESFKTLNELIVPFALDNNQLNPVQENILTLFELAKSDCEKNIQNCYKGKQYQENKYEFLLRKTHENNLTLLEMNYGREQAKEHCPHFYNNPNPKYVYQRQRMLLIEEQKALSLLLEFNTPQVALTSSALSSGSMFKVRKRRIIDTPLTEQLFQQVKSDIEQSFSPPIVLTDDQLRIIEYLYPIIVDLIAKGTAYYLVQQANVLQIFIAKAQGIDIKPGNNKPAVVFGGLNILQTVSPAEDMIYSYPYNSFCECEIVHSIVHHIAGNIHSLQYELPSLS